MSGHGSSEISFSRRGQIRGEEEDSNTCINEVLKLRRKTDAKIEELEQQRNTMPYDSDSPFTKSIQIAPPDSDVTIPELHTFDGTGDPYCYVSQYENLMKLYGFDDASSCKLFTLTLKDGAYGWFRSLSSGSIDSYSQLRKKFLIHFGTYNSKTTYSLMAIKQGSTESLHSYIKRFEDATLDVANLDLKLAMSFLYRGLDVNKSKEFMEYLILEKPNSLEKMYDLARRCIGESWR